MGAWEAEIPLWQLSPRRGHVNNATPSFPEERMPGWKWHWSCYRWEKQASNKETDSFLQNILIKCTQRAHWGLKDERGSRQEVWSFRHINQIVTLWWPPTLFQATSFIWLVRSCMICPLRVASYFFDVFCSSCLLRSSNRCKHDKPSLASGTPRRLFFLYWQLLSSALHTADCFLSFGF